jgi:hypothetical protein
MRRLQPLCCLTAGLLASACPWTLTAQTPTEEAQALEARLPAPKPAQGRDTFELSEARQARLKKLLPDTWRKLSQREPLNILVLAGERELEIWSEAGKAGVMNTFPAQFARELANQFFYTSGVHEAGKAVQVEALAPGITLRFLSGQDHALVDAAGILGSVARQAPVDLVLICHGLAEADADMSPQSYVRLMSQTVDAARELKAEVFIAAPWLEASAQPEATLGLVRPLADALREAAEEEGWMFVDLGDLTRVMQMPPSDAQGDAQRFDRFASTWRSFFHEEKGGRHLPRATLHQRMGSALFQTMLDGPAAQPVTFEEARATWKEGGAALELHCTVVNESKQEQRLTVLPLIAAGWKPREAQPEVTLAAGTKKTLVIQYARSSAGQVTADEGMVRLPLLIISGSQASIITQRAVLQPVAVVWSSDTLFNQEANFVIGGQILNTSTEEVRGAWEAEFSGNQLNGQIQLKPGAAQPLDLTFAVPKDGETLKSSVLSLKVKLPGLELTSTRQLTLAKNVGLGLPVPLTASTKSSGSVTLQAGADAGRVSFLCEVSGPEMLLPTVDGSPAWQLEVNLDARSYGKRLEAGSTAPVRATGSATAGKGNVLPIQPWAFGTGYAAVFDPKVFQAELKSLGGNQHQIMLTIPRTYLYLHEWALNNGNSQFGLNVRLTLNTAQGYQTWSLVPTSKPANDAAAMGVLELTAKPTQRATVILE